MPHLISNCLSKAPVSSQDTFDTFQIRYSVLGMSKKGDISALENQVKESIVVFSFANSTVNVNEVGISSYEEPLGPWYHDKLEVCVSCWSLFKL